MSAIAKTQLAAATSDYLIRLVLRIVTSEAFQLKSITARSLKDEIL